MVVPSFGFKLPGAVWRARWPPPISLYSMANLTTSVTHTIYFNMIFYFISKNSNCDCETNEVTVETYFLICKRLKSQNIILFVLVARMAEREI